MKPSRNMSWFVEMQGVTLCNRSGRIRLSIPYPHAGLWTLIANGRYRRSRAVALMGILMSTDGPKAEREVDETIAAWTQAGYLTEE